MKKVLVIDNNQRFLDLIAFTILLNDEVELEKFLITDNLSRVNLSPVHKLCLDFKPDIIFTVEFSNFTELATYQKKSSTKFCFTNMGANSQALSRLVEHRFAYRTWLIRTDQKDINAAINQLKEIMARL